MSRRTKNVTLLLGRVLVVIVLGAGIGIALGAVMGDVIPGTALGAFIGLIAGVFLEVSRSRRARR